MKQKPSNELTSLAIAEGFLLTPLFDERVFTAYDNRIEKAKIILDGQEIQRVSRAMVGVDGWIEAYVELENGELLVSNDQLVIRRRLGSVKIISDNGQVFD